MEEIKRLPSASHIRFIECSGNTQSEWAAPTLKTVQGTHGLTSCSEWTGVPLSLLLREAGVQSLPGPGFYEITGLAWSGRGFVRRVEVSTDGGRTWHDATLQEPVLRLAHTRFRFAWRWDGRAAVLQSRCTDDTGYVQPTLAELVKVRGVHSRYHLNAIQAWRVRTDGNVENVHV